MEGTRADNITRPRRPAGRHAAGPARSRHRAAGRRAKARARARGSAGQEAALRTLDIVVALSALMLTGPVLAFLALLVRATSPGPALFRQPRLGRGKRVFTLLKLRTMYVQSDDAIHREYVTTQLTSDQPNTAGRRGLFKLEGDPRVTPVGGLLRRTSLDELPQLLNVLRGDMAVVGPRPVLAWEAELFAARHQRRFEVKPGITGLWQVSGRSRLTMQEALDLDAEYVRRRSLAFDLLILIRTLPALVRGGAA